MRMLRWMLPIGSAAVVAACSSPAAPDGSDGARLHSAQNPTKRDGVIGSGTSEPTRPDRPNQGDAEPVAAE